ncbi:hypothetical protein [Aquibacillus salsiterrae]|uniref:Uncharacterized protein n=1 Tax=Aquibacillus salsiterrae TaxID=2950439 RepID=A0A9X3WFW1_9BACI|nr:hypothetical protein [Aquibacillus salsiterrae]MDC3416689.1 hypothetical protein [Aquibacillus salsiterrae]
MSAQTFSQEYLEKIKKLEEAAEGVYVVPNYHLKNQDEMTKEAIRKLKERNNIKN